MTTHHLAQCNVGRLRAPLDDPRLAEFVALLPVVNGIADATPGFVWRFTDGGGMDATGVRPYGDDVIVNMSVWESVEALRDFTYRSSHHLEPMRRRREWFLPYDRPHLALWWVPAGHRPTVDEGLARLAALERTGASADAFTLREPYPPPGAFAA